MNANMTGRNQAGLEPEKTDSVTMLDLRFTSGWVRLMAVGNSNGGRVPGNNNQNNHEQL
jgi:hypothetical protein